MAYIDFSPTRSLIYISVAKEDYRVKLLDWLNRVHVPDSISQFAPYVTKYAYYNTLPVPEGGELFGTANCHLVEHYWNVNESDRAAVNSIFEEIYPPEVLLWQNNISEEDLKRIQDQQFTGDDGRSATGGTIPFVFAQVPMWWEKDVKGKGRTLNDGPNYRWNFCVGYPEGVSQEEGDRWLSEKVFPVFEEMPECTRIVTSRVMKELNKSI